jgi:hypothetical protein
MLRLMRQLAAYLNPLGGGSPPSTHGGPLLSVGSSGLLWMPSLASPDTSNSEQLQLPDLHAQGTFAPGTAPLLTRRTLLRLRRPRSDMSQCTHHDCEPPAKKQRRPDIVRLPDNVVLRILDLLSGAPRAGELSGRALTQARDAFALAQTCKRFLDLFRSSAMRTIIFDYSSAVVVSSTRGGRHEKQLSRLCAFAGKHVTTLTISGCYEGHFDTLFRTIETRCPNILHIDISDSDYDFTFSKGLLSLLESRPWKTVRMPMGMRSTMPITPNPSPSEPDSAFLFRLAGTSGAARHLQDITDIALPTRLPACSELAITVLWNALPNLRVFSLSADLPESLLASLPIACPNLVELRLNLLARPKEDFGYPRTKHNPIYSRLLKGCGATLQKLMLGFFDLDLNFVTDFLKDCPHLESIELRECRDFDANIAKLLAPRLVSLRETYLNSATVAVVPAFATNLEACDLLLDDEQLEVDMTDSVIQWAIEVGSLPHLQQLVIKGPEDRIVVRWDTVMAFLVDSVTMRSERLNLRSLRVERVKGLTADLWAMLLRAVGHSLQVVSAFESQPLSALQFISLVSRFCPRVERIRLPRLWGQGGDEELYDAISELMRLESRAPHCCVAALRMNTDFCFTFERRGGLEWVADEGM